MNPSNPNQIFLATTEGIFRTNNALDTVNSVSWSRVLDENPNTFSQFRGLAFKPGDPSTIYASGINIYRSIDGGDTWETIVLSRQYVEDPNCFPNNSLGCNFVTHASNSDPMFLDLSQLADSFKVYRINITTTEQNPNNLYAYISGVKGTLYGSGNSAKAIYVYQYSPNTGWQQKYYFNTTNPFKLVGWSRMAITVHPNDPDYIIIGTTMVYQIDSNRSDTISPYSGSGFHADVHALAFPPGDTANLFCGNDGGVSVKYMPGNLYNTYGWTYKHNGLMISKSWGFDDWERDPNYLAMGNQDVGENISYDRGQNWTQIAGADGFGTQIDNISGDLYYNNGSFGWKVGPNTADTSWILPANKGFFILMNPNNNLPVYNNTNYSNYFKVVNHPQTDDLYFVIGEIHVGNDSSSRMPLNMNYYITKSNIGRDTNSSHNGTPRPINNFVIAESNPNVQYISTSGYRLNNRSGQGGVGWGAQDSEFWKTENGGLDHHWTDDLPNLSNTTLYDNYTSWIDLTDSLNHTTFTPPGGTYSQSGHPPITEIAVDPGNHNRVWISLSGYSDTMKVMRSDDGGYSWTNADPNGTLCNFPVNNIVYQPGTNDRLYIGTDVGVFVRNTQTGDWEKYGDFPHVRVTGLKLNSCLGKLRVATFGRGIWEGDLLPRQYPLAGGITVDQDLTWDYVRVLTNGVHVKNGATLTIKDTVFMPKDGFILVEPGSKVVLDSAVLTNTCGETWYGIVVKGQDSLGQSPLYQGMITMNDALIEHSRYGVRLHNGWLSQHSGGGIIDAEDCIFKNNWHAIDFSQYHHPYINPTTNEEAPNVSKIRNCTFTVDDDLRDFQTTKPFSGHIGMWDVTGVKILGCRFENLRSNFTKAEDGGHGIVSVDAQFYVTHDCNGIVPCNSYDTTSFYRLFEGIRVANISSIKSAIVDKCVFKECHYGVFNDAADLLSVTRSDFEVGGFPKNKANGYVQEGIVLNNATGFTITENTMVKSSAYPNNSYRIGVRVADAGEKGNEIYNNEMDNLFFGNLANGDNANDTLGIDDGLQFRCNQFTDNTVDINAYSGDPVIRLTIARNQGSNAVPTGNTFSNTLTYNVNNFDSLYQDVINFYYYNGNSDEDPTLIKNTTPISINEENGCSSQLPGSSGTNGTATNGMLLSSEVATLTSNYFSALSNYNSNLADYNSSIDGNNTAGVLEQVETTTEAEASNTISDLEDLSPWVSQTVLVALVDNEEISVEDIVSVLEQNPDVLRRVDFMKYVIDSDRLSSNQLDDLYTAMGTSTARTNLGSLITAYAGDKFRAAKEIMRNYLNDTISIKEDSIELWLERERSLSTTYMLLELYRQQKNWTKAKVILDSIPHWFALTEKQTTAYNDYKSLHQILHRTDTAGLSFFELGSNDYNTVQTLATKGYERAHVQAQTILNYAYDANYRRPPLFAEEVQERQVFEKKEETVPSQSIWTQPNPARDWVMLRIQKEGLVNARLMITDSYGHILQEQQLNNEQSEIQLNTSSWSPGTYFAILHIDGEKPEVTRFVIVK